MTLKIGPEPESLDLSFAPGEAWDAALVLKLSGVDEPWPAAPLLVFENGEEWQSVIDPERDARAVWAQTAEDVTAIGEGGVCRLKVEGKTWWLGVAVGDA